MADRLTIIISGWVKLSRHTSEGEEAIINLLTRGHLLGDSAIATETPYPYSAHAAEQTSVLEINGGAFRALCIKHPHLTTQIMRSMSDELKNSRAETEHLSLMTAPQRVGCLLLQMSSGMHGKGGTFTFPYDKSLAAAKLGMTPETFSRALSHLKPAGVMVKGSEINIKNFHELINYVCNHCSALPGECRGSRQQGCTTQDCKSCIH
jgi:CRP-like cAMP-binding protein